MRFWKNPMAPLAAVVVGPEKTARPRPTNTMLTRQDG